MGEIYYLVYIIEMVVLSFFYGMQNFNIYLYKIFTKCSVNRLHDTKRCAVVLHYLISLSNLFVAITHKSFL